MILRIMYLYFNEIYLLLFIFLIIEILGACVPEEKEKEEEETEIKTCNQRPCILYNITNINYLR